MNKTMILAALCATAVQANTAQSGFFLDAAVGFSHDNSKIIFKDNSDKPGASKPAAGDEKGDAIPKNCTLTKQEIDELPLKPLRDFLLREDKTAEPTPEQKMKLKQLISDYSKGIAAQPLTSEQTTYLNKVRNFIKKMGQSEIKKLMTDNHTNDTNFILANINGNRILLNSQENIDSLFRFDYNDKEKINSIINILQNSDLTEEDLCKKAQDAIDKNNISTPERKNNLKSELNKIFDNQKKSKNAKKLKGGSSSTTTLKDGTQFTINNKSNGSLALRIGAGYRYIVSPKCANSFMASFAVDHTFIFGTKKVDWILKKNPIEKDEGRFNDKTFGRTAFVFSPGYCMRAFSIYADLGLSLNYVKISNDKIKNSKEKKFIGSFSKTKVIPAFLVGLGMSYQIAPKMELYANGRVHFLKKWKIKGNKFRLINNEVDLMRKGTAFEMMVGMRFAV